MNHIEMRDADARRQGYGITRESVTLHRFHGRGIHNPGFPHRLEFWRNRSHVDGGYVDPLGRRTDQPNSWLWAAEAVALTATPQPPRDPEGVALQLGDTVVVDGETLTIAARLLHNPHCEPTA